jgi:hypothetical protein
MWAIPLSRANTHTLVPCLLFTDVHWIKYQYCNFIVHDIFISIESNFRHLAYVINISWAACVSLFECDCVDSMENKYKTSFSYDVASRRQQQTILYIIIIIIIIIVIIINCNWAYARWHFLQRPYIYQRKQHISRKQHNESHDFHSIV